MAEVSAGGIWGSCGFVPRELLAGAALMVREEASSPSGQQFQESGLKLPGEDDKGGEFREESGTGWRSVMQ